MLMIPLPLSEEYPAKDISVVRKGQELSWFCPSVFFYLCAVCPSVWILEIQMTSLRRERLCLYYQLVQERLSSPANDTRYQVSLLLELMQASESDLQDYDGVCSKDNLVISEDFKKKVESQTENIILVLMFV